MENSEEIRKKAFNSYMKNWRKNNPDKVKKNNINYWIRRALKENSRNNGSNWKQSSGNIDSRADARFNSGVYQGGVAVSSANEWGDRQLPD